MLASFLNSQGGFVLSEAEQAEAAHAVQLSLVPDEAATLHHAIARSRFEKFVDAALSTCKAQLVVDETLISTQACFEVLYARCRRSADGSWPHDLDVAAHMGCEQGGDEELLAASVLRDAAGGLLRLARARFCLRGVLLETLARRPLSGTGWKGHVQMYRQLQSAKLAVSEGEFNSLVWFVRQAEYSCYGRLWAPAQGDAVLASPRYLCELARGSERRVQALAEVFHHSVVLREPVRAFLDAHLMSFAEKAWLGGPPGLLPRSHLGYTPWSAMDYACGADVPHYDEFVRDPNLLAWGLDGFMRRGACVLASVAIELPACFDGLHNGPPPLLVALRHLAAAWGSLLEERELNRPPAPITEIGVFARVANVAHALSPKRLRDWLSGSGSGGGGGGSSDGGGGTGGGSGYGGVAERRSVEDTFEDLRAQCRVWRAPNAAEKARGISRVLDSCPASAITYLFDAIAPYLDGLDGIPPVPPHTHASCWPCALRFDQGDFHANSDEGERWRNAQEDGQTFEQWYEPNYARWCCKSRLIWRPFAFP